MYRISAPQQIPDFKTHSLAFFGIKGSAHTNFVASFCGKRNIETSFICLRRNVMAYKTAPIVACALVALALGLLFGSLLPTAAQKLPLTHEPKSREYAAQLPKQLASQRQTKKNIMSAIPQRF